MKKLSTAVVIISASLLLISGPVNSSFSQIMTIDQANLSTDRQSLKRHGSSNKSQAEDYRSPPFTSPPGPFVTDPVRGRDHSVDLPLYHLPVFDLEHQREWVIYRF